MYEDGRTRWKIYINEQISSVGLWATLDGAVQQAGPATTTALLREFDAVIEQLAVRVNEVLTRGVRISDWARVHRMRGAQRLLLLQLVLYSERRGYRKLRSIVEMNIDVIAQAGEKREMGGVYIRVNRLTHRMRYVGQTGSFQRRDEEHLRKEAHAAAKEGCAQRTTKTERTTMYYEFTAKHGGPGQWIYLPVVVMDAATNNRDRVRVERKMIRRYGTLNVAYSVWSKAVRKKPRHRPVMRLRGKSE